MKGLNAVIMKREPLEGRMIGFWKVISYEGCDEKKSWYKCQCTGWGAIRMVRADKLVSGRSKQCADCSFSERRRKGKIND